MLLLLLALQLFACGPAQQAESTSPPAPASDLPVGIVLDESFRLMAGQQGELEAAGLIIQFQTVLDDWRCPSQVNCAEAGNAAVVIEVELAGLEPSRFELNVNPPGKQAASYEAYEIRLLALEPYPEVIDQTIPVEDYEATLEVSKE